MGAPQNGEADFVGKRSHSEVSRISIFLIEIRDTELVTTQVCAVFYSAVIHFLRRSVSRQEALPS